jgi:NitT/TauT family transport system ATP-binding protein
MGYALNDLAKIQTNMSQETTAPKIQASNLTVQFAGNATTGSITALHDLNLTVQSGEFVCVVGSSGCGKTTLLRVLAGLERPATGSAHIISAESKRPDFAIVFQDAGLFPWMTVLDNITFGMRMQGVSGRERYAIAQEWINRVGLARFVDSFPNQLSGGMKQRVGLARAFAHNPEVLLMDEPFGALDAQTRLVLQETLLDLWKNSDMTVLFVTHSIEEALTLADRIVVMSARPGRILQTFDVDFPRPREVMALRTNPKFGERYAEIWDILREQVRLSSEEHISP